MIVFNTGRHYGPEGQVIKAKKVRWEGRPGVAFVDHTRMVTGFIPYCELTETNILYHYDKGHYKSIWGPELKGIL